MATEEEVFTPEKDSALFPILRCGNKECRHIIGIGITTENDSYCSWVWSWQYGPSIFDPQHGFFCPKCGYFNRTSENQE